MSEESLAVQRLFLAKLTASAPLLALLPATSIFDRNRRPEVFPCIMIGEAQTVGDDVDCGPLSSVYSTLHVWTKEEGLRDCKTIGGATRRALWDASADDVDGFKIEGTTFEDARFLRDPSSEHAHGILTFVSLVGGP